MRSRDWRVTRAEEFFASVKDGHIMLIPTHPGAGAEGIGDSWNRCERSQGEFECSREVCWAVFVCKREGLLGIQTELIGLSS